MYSSQLDAAKNAADAMKTLFGDIESAINSLTGSQAQINNQAYVSAKAQLDTALTLAKATGVLPDPTSFKATLDAVSNVDANNFASFFDFQREQLQTAGKLSQLNSVVGGKAAQQNATVVAIEASIASIESLKVATQSAADNCSADLDKKHKETIDLLISKSKLLEDQYEADVFYFDGLLLFKAKEQLEIANGTYQAIWMLMMLLS